MDLEHISDEFRLQQANRYSLWLHLSDDYCSFVIFDDASKSFVGMKRVDHISLTKTIELFDELSSIPFGRIFIALNAQPSVLVPSVLFRQENKRDLLSFAAEFNEDYEVVTHHIASLSAVNVFALAPSFKTIVTPYFPQASLIHISSALLMALSVLSQAEMNPTMGVRFLDNCLSICIFHGERLSFFNQFMVKAPEDIVYWILRVSEQFGLQTATTVMYVQGVQNMMDDNVLLLKRYFQRVSLIPFPAEFQLSPELKAEPVEMFTDLFYLPLCEL